VIILEATIAEKDPTMAADLDAMSAILGNFGSLYLDVTVSADVETIPAMIGHIALVKASMAFIKNQDAVRGAVTNLAASQFDTPFAGNADVRRMMFGNGTIFDFCRTAVQDRNTIAGT
jgi:hypothetical protein